MDRWVDFKSYQVFKEATNYTALQFYTGAENENIRISPAPTGFESSGVCLSAELTSESPAENAVFLPGKTFEKTWWLRNTGDSLTARSWLARPRQTTRRSPAASKPRPGFDSRQSYAGMCDV
ncbi:MAG: hypothetical protein IIA53_00180 [Chloroflexi bacterium]|nr:hypothetical protein [Chloroflexota bacterium]